MIEFHILKKSRKSSARLGILKTPHGEVETPALIPVASQAVIKTLTSDETRDAGCQMLICNTFLLHARPGESKIHASGGLHKFMAWPHPLMTDSGGFQIFSLGFGKDLGVGKVLKYFPGRNKTELIRERAQPSAVRITEKGVYFNSPLDGKKFFLGPRESIKIQEKLGADIIFTFDECTPPLASKAYIKRSLARTHRWAKECLRAKKSRQALFGIVQGSKFKDLREESARFLNAFPFDGFGIGGDLGSDKSSMRKILSWTIPHLAEGKPRHLLGIGHLEDMEMIIKSGIDLFDCTVPTHYARNGIAFTSSGKLSLRKAAFLNDEERLDPKCGCMVCGTYRRNYLSHLCRAKEMTASRLLTFHNLFFFNKKVAELRERIKNGKI